MIRIEMRRKVRAYGFGIQTGIHQDVVLATDVGDCLLPAFIPKRSDVIRGKGGNRIQRIDSPPLS